eukprot:comp18469_c0_seq1/m.19790 comp18469_c0_seq1/g.19790  ORF comp18469_c0_seq1/g.19790 comp18469_c0_seq1/m.19790 type:complete len:383 (-) comp18469_c0_seq1:671-1819(-)
MRQPCPSERSCSNFVSIMACKQKNKQLVRSRRVSFADEKPGLALATFREFKSTEPASNCSSSSVLRSFHYDCSEDFSEPLPLSSCQENKACDNAFQLAAFQRGFRRTAGCTEQKQPLYTGRGTSNVQENVTRVMSQLQRTALPQRHLKFLFTPNRCSRVVELVHCTFEPWTSQLQGTVSVANIAFHKRVFARYTLDCWRSFADAEARFLPLMPGQNRESGRDLFQFAIRLPCGMECGERLSFAIGYEVNGKFYWDNNYGANFDCEMEIICKAPELAAKVGVVGAQQASSAPVRIPARSAAMSVDYLVQRARSSSPSSSPNLSPRNMLSGIEMSDIRSLCSSPSSPRSSLLNFSPSVTRESVSPVGSPCETSIWLRPIIYGCK